MILISILTSRINTPTLSDIDNLVCWCRAEARTLQGVKKTRAAIICVRNTFDLTFVTHYQFRPW